MAYFIFTPSDNLKHEIEQIIQHQHSTDIELYPLRDNLAFRMNDELIDTLLTGLVQVLPASEKRNIAEKLASTVKTTVYTLLNQLLSKADNQTVQPSIQFVQNSYYQFNGQPKFGMPLDAQLVENLLNDYDDIHDGKAIDKQQFVNQYKLFAEQVIQHFMIDFNQTLNLGLIKRKASDLATSATIKATHLAIDKMIPQLKDDELRIMADYHRQFLEQSS